MIPWIINSKSVPETQGAEIAIIIVAMIGIIIFTYYITGKKERKKQEIKVKEEK